MNRKGLSKQAQAKIAKLRARLEQDFIADHGEDLRSTKDTSDSPNEDESLSDSPTAIWLSDKEEQMLSIVLSDALNGVDILDRYPTFYQKLRANGKLREAFLEALDLLEQSRMGELVPLPAPPSRDLGFLQIASPAQTVELSPSGAWRIRWVQVAEQLRNLFFSPPLSAELTYRSEIDLLEEVPFTVFQSEVWIPQDSFSGIQTEVEIPSEARGEVNGVKVTALLEATQPLDVPETLRLSLTVALAGDMDEKSLLRGLNTRLQWGEYDETAPIDSAGQAVFPPISLSTVLDENRERVRADLHLTLEAETGK